MATLDLPNGYYDLPPGKLVNVVTCLEMNQNPQVGPQTLPADYSLRVIEPSNLAGYRALFSEVGIDNMWFSRAIMPDEKLAALLSDPKIESYALVKGEVEIGILELNFTEMPNCELAFFGLTKDAIGSGLGRALMNVAIDKAWAKPIDRLWVHTCHFDHPNALPFYQRSGFKPYALMVEVHDDPRQTGHLPRHASPQVALIEK
jgi:GNAT superfamily N-acetyltransferase